MSAIAIMELETGILQVERRDAMIAATALVHGMTVATRNMADFERTNVRLFNPWQIGQGEAMSWP